MAFGKIFGKLLFVFFLLMRGIQHQGNPASYPLSFNKAYSAFHNHISPNVYFNQIPPEIRGHLQPERIKTHVDQYLPFIGYVELFLALCIFLDVPFLPLFAAGILTVETIVFYNPFRSGKTPELYYCIVNLAIIGISLMMSFEAPKRVVRVVEDEPEAEQPSESSNQETSKKPKGKKGRN